ncbi:MAG: thioredoxin-dependent thiol peroxidase [Elusimicrobia bacterium]|nr:thioredoxin-dependent thiol peroxidase [Elusimicrobiota bacterium]
MNKTTAPLEIGDKAPDFKLKDDADKEVSLSDFKGKTLVLYFYPKDDTPGCTKEACDFRDNYKRFQSKNTAILGVSRDSTDSHSKFKKKYNLPFPLLADEGGKMTEDYGVWLEKSMYGKKYMGIERTTFIIDPSGSIREIIRKVKVDGHSQDLLTKI